MNLKPLIATIIIAILVGIAGAEILKQYYHEMTAEVVSITLTRTFNGTILTDDEQINWGIVEPDTTTVAQLNVTNTGTAPCNVTLWHNAPIGWTITWSLNNTRLEPSESAVAPLDLYVPADAIQGSVETWDCYVRAIEP